jgi:uridine kinase
MERYVIGAAGGTGAGKTTLAEALADSIGPGRAVIVHEDRYYKDNSHLPAASRESLNYDHPDAIDLDLLAGHVRELVSGRAVMQPVYDFVHHVRSRETVTLLPAKFIIVEGLFTLSNKLLREVIDFKVFLDLDESERLARRIERDIRERGRSKESVVHQWNATVQPMHERFIQPSRSFAHMVLPGGDPVECNAARIRDYLISIIPLAGY